MDGLLIWDHFGSLAPTLPSCFSQITFLALFHWTAQHP